MFTKNWYKAIGTWIGGTAGLDTYATVTGDSFETKLLSRLLSPGVKADSNDSPSLWYLRKAMSGNPGVVLGTGNTPPTMDDIKLAGDIITTFDYNSNVTIAVADDGVAITAVYTITNTGASEITIGEVCLIGNAYNGANTAEKYKILLERTALEIPITIAPGGVGQVTYTIRMNYPA